MLKQRSAVAAGLLGVLALTVAAPFVNAQPPAAGAAAAQAPAPGRVGQPPAPGGRAGATPKAGYVVPPENSGGLYPVSGEPIWRDNCASCHEPAVDRAPTRQELSNRSPEEVYDILKTGSMAPLAADLTEAQIYGVIRFVTGKSPTPNAVRGPDPNMCVAGQPLHPAAPSWNGWSPENTNTRYQPNPGFTAAQIPQLKVKWAFSYPGTKNTAPVMFGGRVYTASLGGYLYSLDQDTGCVHWRYDFPGGTRSSPVIAPNAGAPSGYAAYFGDDRSFVHAVDAGTGAPLWKVKVDNHPVGRITGSIVVHDGVIYVPMSSSEESQGNVGAYGCCTFIGMVIAVDAKDGRTVWKQKVLDVTPRPTRLNTAGTQMYGPAGDAIWSAPTIDARRGQLYVATGDSYSEVENGAADAIVAMDLKTGRLKWVNQVLANDNYVSGRVNAPLGQMGPDYDFGQSPMLVRTPEGRELVVTGNKSSIVYAMDPDTGAMVWETPKLGTGGASGGMMWGSAYDPASGTVYSPNADGGQPPRAKPGVFAFDVNTGAVRWFFDPPRDLPCNVPSGRCSVRHSGAATAMPGAVFAGSLDGRLRAFSATDGRVLWEFDTTTPRNTVNGLTDAPGGGLDMAGPTIAGGMMFLHSGYNGSAGPNNMLLAFTVDGR